MLHRLIFGTTALRLYWQVFWQCRSLIKLYSGLFFSTLWMNLVQRAALRSSRVVRPAVERASSCEIPGRIIARARLWTFSRAHAYSTTDLKSEQYTRTRSSVATPLFFSGLMSWSRPIAFLITASQCTARVRSCDIWTPSSLKYSTRLTAKPPMLMGYHT